MKNSYVELTSNLYLLKQITTQQKSNVVTIREPNNHIWIYDRSGSMSGLLSGLCKQMIEMSKNIPIGDTITIGWFASEGDYNFILKGFKISENRDYSTLEKAINNNNYTKGCTCFSEILTSTKDVITDLSVFSPKFCLSFFTDGYPVVSDYKLEELHIFNAIRDIKGSLHSTMFIGFGRNYNKELLGRMAESANGILCHNSEISEYVTTTSNFLNLSEQLSPKVEIENLDKNALAIFNITTDGVILYSSENSVLQVNTIGDLDIATYYITRTKPKNATKIASDKELQGLYAAIYVLVQTVKIDLALEFSGKVGDVKVIDDINNAFTITDYVNVENFVKSAIIDNKNRFLNGKNDSYLPKADVFCAFGLFKILVNDNDCYFYPQHEKFKYEKIGISMVHDKDAPKFTMYKNAKCSFNNLTWNDKKLNLSTPPLKLHGSLKLNPVNGNSPEIFGLPSEINTYVYRVYTLIKDGMPNVESFYVSTSKQTYDILKSHNVVIDDDFNGSGIYGINLKSLPVMNRAIADKNLSAVDLCTKLYEELQYQATLKVLKYQLELLNPSEFVKSDEYTIDQQSFLFENGIDLKSGAFQWKTVNENGASELDFYMAKCFDIKISGFSSLPKVEEVIEKIKNPKTDKNGNVKPLTQSQQLIAEGINNHNNLVESTIEYNKTSDNKKSLIEVLELEIKKVSTELKLVRSNIQETKFAIILGKKWFKEFTSNIENQIIVNGITYTFERSEVKVLY